ncbi:YpjP family protein [Sutcliffiella deserti]|uniref:YpjP family protein n=1 Tax=Sutcliffiella deserti TaxID=2875501 RepID=UPI001CC02D59|nr:YpjP family protein [Sutcliffiella deserti]
MPKWLKKSLVVLITALTFGTVSPPAYLFADETSDDTNFSDIKDNEIDSFASGIYESIDNQVTQEAFLTFAVEQAKLQSMTKFGTKIAPVIEDEFQDVIFPKMEEVITTLALEHPTEDLSNLTISESPTGGDSEKIFHIYHTVSGQDVVRFHVRKDNPPKEGYWFNFHYHTYHDQFQEHHVLGSIFWAKNMPPKWLS